MTRHSGNVKWFNDAKGFGFITSEDVRDVFCHHSAIQMGGRRTLEEGQRVECGVEETPKGLSAVDVARL